MKAVLSQTIFCGGAHLHGSVGNRLLADLDSNGWPQTGRNKALAEIRKCFAVHIAGDQHLATIFQHGIDDLERRGLLASACPRSPTSTCAGGSRWNPARTASPARRTTPASSSTASATSHRVAAANPDPVENRDKLTTRAAGFGVAKFNKNHPQDHHGVLAPQNRHHRSRHQAIPRLAEHHPPGRQLRQKSHRLAP